jgi:hypothetical protein
MPRATVPPGVPGPADGSSIGMKVLPLWRKPWVVLVAEKSDDLACIIDAESLSALGQGSIQRGEAAAAKDETVKDVAGPERSDDLARAIDAKWVGVLGSQGIVDRGEDIDWHGFALLPRTFYRVSAPMVRRPGP